VAAADEEKSTEVSQSTEKNLFRVWQTEWPHQLIARIGSGELSHARQEEMQRL
jgi:hypothetical protein